MASRTERKQRRAREASSVVRRQLGTRALVVGFIVAAILGFSLGWLVRMRTDRTPEERVREKTGEVRERVRELAR
jgi:hypothetical protein